MNGRRFVQTLMRLGCAKVRILFVCILGVCNLANASISTLQQKAGLQGKVPVIITFSDMAGFTPQSLGLKSKSLESSEFTDLKLAAIRERQQSVLQALGSLAKAKQPANDNGNIKQYDFVPQMALSVNAQELELLRQLPNLIIQEDVMHKPMLQQSVARVYPTQGVSNYHGDNDWVVAVLDSGVDASHPFLSGKLVSEACYSNGGGTDPRTSSLCPGGVTVSTASGSGDACTGIDQCQHGTQVAGAAIGNGASFDGVARDARLISIQVYTRIDDTDLCFPEVSCLRTFASDVIDGLERVYQLRNSFNIASVTLSAGSNLVQGTCDNQPEAMIMGMLKSAGIATVVASGNDGSPSSISTPACVSDAIAVGSSSKTADVRSSFSNSSVALDLYAPGESINTSVPGGGFAISDNTSAGTSLAAAHVAGAWAVIRHRLPNASVAQVEGLLKSNGPSITVAGITRRRLSVSGVLTQIDPDHGQGSGSGDSTSFIPPIISLLLDED